MKKNFIALLFSNFLLIMGVVSLLLIIDGAHYYSGILILIAAVYHHFEPMLSEALNFPVEPEKEDNRPANLLVFAINPIILTYVVFNFKTIGFLSLVPSLLFPMAALYQLNKQKTTKDSLYFPLLPLSYSSAALTIFVLLLQSSPTLRFLVYLIMIFLAYLMIRPKSS